ncbi:hypothetical protein NQ314_004093 [Rhamnusium bicolor]|uniref:PiggyBac transposable element-derived protein domain-containing protein n=1 Tax=Rhamnusium bicolor TaxID=1586634 RepID=A0AAV8ZMK7_9CUCU|nr:hypothetical protein NQ314_004093 [Rhamnusium bicolor]
MANDLPERGDEPGSAAFEYYFINMEYEAEQARLQRFFDEVSTDSAPEPDDDDTSLPDEQVEVLEYDTNSEQDFSDGEDSEEYIPMQQTTRVPYLLEKDGTRWRKHPSKQRNIRTRAENIVPRLPGPKGDIGHKLNNKDIWECFYTTDMLESIVKYTNKFISMQSYDIIGNRTTRPIDLLELKAFLGLLYISGANKSNRQNAEDIFRTNGTHPSATPQAVCNEGCCLAFSVRGPPT